jgi:lipopolysaccharide transport system ATP-binding protein
MTAEFLGRDGHHNLRQDEFWSVRDISFELKRGERLGLIGPNGAGKTTLLRMINGLIKPDEGRITIRGRVGALIALGAGFNPILTGRENIYVNAAVLGIAKREIDRVLDDIISFADLSDFIDTPVQNYSSGMHVRLGFSVAAHLQPDIFLIDEVLAVGDYSFQKKCFDRLDAIVENGTAIIFVSHSMAAVQRLCPIAMLMKKGRAVFFGASTDAAAKYFQNITNENYQKSDDSAKRNRIIHLSGEMNTYLAAFEVLNGQDQPVERIKSGEFLRFVLKIRSKNNVSERLPRIAIRVLDMQTEELLANIQTPQKLMDETKPNSELALECSVPSFNLAPGIYKYVIKIGGDGADTVHDLAMIGQPFEINWSEDIINNMYYKGKIYLPGQWGIGNGRIEHDS